MFDSIKKKIKDSLNSIQNRFLKEEKSEIKEDIKKEEEILDQDKKEIKKDIIIEDKRELKEEIKEVDKEIKELSNEEKKEEKNEITINENKNQTKKEHTIKYKSKEGGKKPIFSHIIDEKDVDSIYLGIKSALLENNAAISVLDKIHEDLKIELIGKSVSMLNSRKQVEEAVRNSIKDILIDYDIEEFISKVKSKKPFVILIIGVNGAGKTTTIAKLCNFFIEKKIKPVIAAADTFRAASIEQIEVHAKRLRVEVVKHTYGADPAAVAFDAVKHAVSDKDDVVLIDTAGRSDINKNLIEELKKVKRVSKPDMTIFIGDALTGNDVVKQAEIFDKEIGIDFNILSKADVDKKGGAVLSISYVTKKPILFLGTGQEYKDLIPFDKVRTAEFILGS